MKIKLFLGLILALSTVLIHAGTIIYKTNPKDKEHILPKVKIVSIAKKTITLEKDGGIRTIPLSYLVSYYDTDIETGDFADNTCDYTITLRDIKMPDTGYIYTKNKKSKRKSKRVAKCEIEFSVNKKIEPGKTKTIRMPYFFLYVLTTGKESYGRRPVYFYYYPKEAKISSKTYDEAQIIEVVNSMKRPRIYSSGTGNLDGAIGKLSSGSGHRPANIELKGIKNQKIIAYHLEIWGKNKMIKEKDWKDIKYKVGKNWWKRY